MKFKEVRKTTDAGDIRHGRAAWIDRALYIRVHATDLAVAAKSIHDNHRELMDLYPSIEQVASVLDNDFVLFVNLVGGGLLLVHKTDQVVSEPTAAYSFGAQE